MVLDASAKTPILWIGLLDRVMDTSAFLVLSELVAEVSVTLPSEAVRSTVTVPSDTDTPVIVEMLQSTDSLSIFAPYWS